MSSDHPADQSFARRYRLTKTDEFSSVFGFRRAIRGRLLMLHYQPRPESADPARLGLVVGKKLVKPAVGRNLVKRITRETFRRLRPQLPACDLVIRLMAKPGRMDAAFRRTLAAEVAELLDRLNRRAGTDPK